MSRTRDADRAAWAVVAGTALLYGARLSYVPPYLAHDEVLFAMNAHDIAATGRDWHGRLLPLFFQNSDTYWATPIIVYTTAAVLKMLPLGETVIRLVTVGVGALDVWLTYLVGSRAFRSPWTAVLAAALIALTPAHFIHSRLAVDHLYPLPFLLGSVFCLLLYLDRHDRRALFAATTLQGIGMYSYLGAAVGMPLYFLLTCAFVVAAHGRPTRALVAATAGFVWPLVFLVPWLLHHPEQLTGQINAYALYDASALDPLRGIRELLRPASVAARVNVYYEFFNPIFLFVSGDSSMQNSTRAAGVFLLPLAPLILAGVVGTLGPDRPRAHVVILSALALAPVAALAVVEVRVNRALVMLPFGALTAAIGAERLLASPERAWRYAAVALIAIVPIQFGLFYRNYFTSYRETSAFWFEQNIRGTLEEVIARDRAGAAPAIYITRTPRWIDWYWRFYLAKGGRPELAVKTAFAPPDEIPFDRLPAGAIVAGQVEEVERSAFYRSGRAKRVARITEPDGRTSYLVFEK